MYTGDLLDRMRGTGDVKADAFIEQTFSRPEAKTALYAFLQNPVTNDQIQIINPVGFDAPFAREIVALPVWADEKMMAKGARFFARHAQPVMNLLALLSLPYCYAAADGARVLSFSERMKNDVQKRLYDTAGFVWEMMAPDAFSPKGYGLFHLLKVRLMHAAVRYYIKQSASWKAEYGLPVNQEDMAGTNLSFSLIAIRGLRKFGHTLSYPDQQAFMHLWNVVGYGLGLDDFLLPKTGKQAIELEQAIRERQFKKSEHGHELAQSLIGFLSTAETPGNFSRKQIIQLMRYLLGKDVACLLSLPKEEISSRTLDLIKINSAFDAFKMQIKPAQDYKKAYRSFKRQKQAAG